MPERNSLAVIDRLFGYLLIIHEQAILTGQALNLFEKHENETGWKILRVV